jgi:antitoxin component YwqK of YwqJK toxin-antitoxin module
MSECPIKNDKCGDKKEYYEDGKLKSITTYENGYQYSGVCKEYYKNGKLKGTHRLCPRTPF